MCRHCDRVEKAENDAHCVTLKCAEAVKIANGYLGRAEKAEAERDAARRETTAMTHDCENWFNRAAECETAKAKMKELWSKYGTATAELDELRAALNVERDDRAKAEARVAFLEGLLIEGRYPWAKALGMEGQRIIEDALRDLRRRAGLGKPAPEAPPPTHRCDKCGKGFIPLDQSRSAYLCECGGTFRFMEAPKPPPAAKPAAPRIWRCPRCGKAYSDFGGGYCDCGVLTLIPGTFVPDAPEGAAP